MPTIRYATLAEFTTPNRVYPAGDLCLIRDVGQPVQSVRFADGVTAFNSLVTFDAEGGTNSAEVEALITAAIGASVQGYSGVLDAITAAYTTEEAAKLAGIEALADVTDATNVAAAGAVMSGNFTTTLDAVAEADKQALVTDGIDADPLDMLQLNAAGEVIEGIPTSQQSEPTIVNLLSTGDSSKLLSCETFRTAHTPQAVTISGGVATIDPTQGLNVTIDAATTFAIQVTAPTSPLLGLSLSGKLQITRTAVGTLDIAMQDGVGFADMISPEDLTIGPDVGDKLYGQITLWPDGSIYIGQLVTE